MFLLLLVLWVGLYRRFARRRSIVRRITTASCVFLNLLCFGLLSRVVIRVMLISLILFVL